MWRAEQSGPLPSADAKHFLQIINEHNAFFDRQAPIFVARAPGRLDLMGGIADYSGSLVLELPLANATFVAVQATPDQQVTMFSPLAAEIDAEPHVRLSREALLPERGPLQLDEARRLLNDNPRTRWAAYVAGALVVLHEPHGRLPPSGIRLLIHSSVPLGKGVSSSAALEVATMQALSTLYGLQIPGRELALLCQRVENFIVGAPCGVMDQMTAACGQQGQLLALLCQPAELQQPVALPPEVEIWGIDSGIRHAVSGADYGSVRVGAFMGYRMIAELAGLAISQGADGRIAITDPLWNGYLANITPSQWETAYRDKLPHTISGADFLKRYGGFTDSATKIEAQHSYPVRQSTAHPIYEHQRVRLFRALLQSQQLSEEQLMLLGELMYQSHASYSACGLGSSGTDRLVELVRAAGPAAGLYGAKITGGGSGGTVAVLARRGAREAIDRIIAQYERETGHQTTLLGGSSPGAAQFGFLRLVAA